MRRWLLVAMLHMAGVLQCQASSWTSHQRLQLMRRTLRTRSQSEPTDKGLRYHVALNTKGTFKLTWDFDPATENITFVYDAPASDFHSWVALGFSDYGETHNADFAVLWTDIYGENHFRDAYTDHEGLLHFDNQQDYTLLAAMITRHHVTLQFSRGFDTCDQHDYAIDTGTTHILFASGVGPVGTLEGINITAASPGLQRVQLRKSQLPDPEFPDDTATFTMNVKNVKVPAVETTYWCSVQKLPYMSRKHHIIQFEGDISEGSKGIVHHLEVFHCELPPGEKVRPYNAPCKSMAERPRGLESCRNVIGAWAMGASGVTYPADAGYPIGGANFQRYVMLEVHFNNPDKIDGVVDNSGIKFHVTPSLRRYDAGIMELGLEYTDKYALPPGQDPWVLSGYCVPQCTQVGLPPGGIQVFASQLHTHQTGKRVYTQHFRHGVQLPDLNRDNHYSPHYQEIRKLQQQVHVRRGDSLVTTCEDSTADKTNITMGGFAISDEMCVNYVHYYPKAELEVCKSSVTTASLYRYFQFLREYENEATSISKGISDNYKSIEWTRMNTELLAEFYAEAPLSMQCNQSDGGRFPGQWEGISIPEVKVLLQPEVDTCRRSTHD